jgi:membrane-bound inhibitor of C-type lysozyme
LWPVGYVRPVTLRGSDMTRQGAGIAFGVALLAWGVVSAPTAASAQTFQTFHCADGTRFIAAFYPHDARAYLQIDGAPVTLRKRLSWSAARYSGGGVTMTIRNAGVIVKHARRPATVCEPI